MKRASVIFALVACTPAAPMTNAPTTSSDASAPLPIPEASKPMPTTKPSIAFVEKGPGVLDWDFQLKDIPAFDETTGTVVVADLSHGHIASSLSLVLHWFRPADGARAHEFAVLDPGDASRVLHELDEPEARKELPKLAAKTRERTRAANDKLAEGPHRALLRCEVAKYEGFCTHPQRITCDGRAMELTGDTLGGAKLGWSIAPIDFGGGMKKEMVTCVREAYVDRATQAFVAYVEHICKGGGSDACYMPEQWKATTLR